MSPTDSTPAEPSAYDLLTRPTLELTDAEVELIVIDLRKRRKAYVDQGKKDAPKPKPASSAPKSAEEKKNLQRDLLASMNLDFD